MTFNDLRGLDPLDIGEAIAHAIWNRDFSRLTYVRNEAAVKVWAEEFNEWMIDEFGHPEDYTK